MGSYNPLVFVLGLVTAAGVSGVAYLLAVARGGDEKALGRLYGPLFFTLGVFALGAVAQLYWTDWAGRPVPQYTELFGVATGLFAFMMVLAGFYLYQGLELKALAFGFPRALPPPGSAGGVGLRPHPEPAPHRPHVGGGGPRQPRDPLLRL